MNGRRNSEKTFIHSWPNLPFASGSLNRLRSPTWSENPWCTHRSLCDHIQGFFHGDPELCVKSLTYCAAKNDNPSGGVGGINKRGGAGGSLDCSLSSEDESVVTCSDWASEVWLSDALDATDMHSQPASSDCCFTCSSSPDRLAGCAHGERFTAATNELSFTSLPALDSSGKNLLCS